jgi:hypothetical protein
MTAVATRPIPQIVIAPEIIAKFTAKMSEKAYLLASDILCNYPDYSMEWMVCTNWHYPEQNNANYEDGDEMEADSNYDYIELAVGTDGDLVDMDDKDTYTIHRVTAELLAPSVLAFWIGTLAGEHLSEDYSPADYWDAGDWDAISTDALLQFHFYGSVICG